MSDFFSLTSITWITEELNKHTYEAKVQKIEMNGDMSLCFSRLVCLWTASLCQGETCQTTSLRCNWDTYQASLKINLLIGVGVLHWHHKATYQKVINPHIVWSHANNGDGVVLCRMRFDCYALYGSVRGGLSLQAFTWNYRAVIRVPQIRAVLLLIQVL